jgi:hypothetical protein
MKDACVLETEVLVPRLKRFVRELVEMPDGYRCDWYCTDTPSSVMIVPVTTDGNLVFVRQYWHNLKAHVLEFPAGTVSDGEKPEAAALREESGYALAVRAPPAWPSVGFPTGTRTRVNGTRTPSRGRSARRRGSPSRRGAC